MAKSRLEPSDQPESPTGANAPSTDTPLPPAVLPGTKSGYDACVLETIFSKAGDVFTRPTPRIRELKKTALYVLDTNALLAAFKFGAGPAKDICNQYRKLASQKRIFVPRRAVQEFARNRPEVLKEMYEALHAQRSKLPEVVADESTSCPMLEGQSVHNEYVQAVAGLRQAKSRYRKAIEALQDELLDWSWDDEISRLYSDVFVEERIIDHGMKEGELLAEVDRRNLHNIPPGFRDKKKDDKGVGDFMIWFSMLRLGEARKKPVVFVCNEEKTDWIVRIQNTVLTVRPEIPYEFLQRTGQYFGLVSFSAFLKLVGADDETIEQAREVEVTTIAAQPLRSPDGFVSAMQAVSRHVDRLLDAPPKAVHRVIAELRKALVGYVVARVDVAVNRMSVSQKQALEAVNASIENIHSLLSDLESADAIEKLEEARHSLEFLSRSLRHRIDRFRVLYYASESTDASEDSS